ncbi:hypothetical protein R4K92_14700 [Brachyspira intermedia]|uniref:hypothetical protein n=1 Tax=Brachyspira intermedia TaxID=84377 RepID=UPI003003D3BD
MENTWKSNFNYIDLYEYRINNMISLLNLNNITSVMDLGCGMQTLKNKIPKSIKYIGVDLYKHVDSTIQIDFNKGEFYNENVDIIFCSGIFEYIYNLESFIKNITKNTNIIIGSYTFADDVKERLNRWVNSYDIKSFFEIWYKLGYRNIFLSDSLNIDNYLYPEKHSDRIFIFVNNNCNYNMINYHKISEINLQSIIIKQNEEIKNINIKLDNLINTIAWWIPVKKWRDNFKLKMRS